MKSNDKDILFWIAGAAMYVWGIIVFATYVTQSLRVISFQSTRMIEEGLELFF